MKTCKISFMIGMSGLLLCSCSLIQKNKNSNKEATVEVKKESVLPTDREEIVQPVSAVYTSKEISKGVVKGDWAIESVNGKQVVGEKVPFLKFVPTESKVYGNNGCNVINAEYKYNPSDSTISFSYLSSTMRLCHKEGLTDMEINLALDATRYYSCRLNGDDYLMTFYNDRHEPIMNLMHQNFQFLNGTWAVKEISGEAVNVPKMKLVIDVEEGKIHGNTGCNVINGSLEINMESANSISFQAITKTMMLCPDENYETQLLVALEEAMKAKPLQGGKVEFLDSQDKVVLVLERTSDK
ncbi:MAG: META domain-containing protein [Muribaculaceae bacterium]|nr:META domain-containing protein [Muribaculaceae bacterium]